jgi:uncharacterized protein
MEFPDPHKEEQAPKAEPLFPPLTTLFLLLVAVLLGSMTGDLIIYGLCEIKGVDFHQLLHGLSRDSSLSDRNFVRAANLVKHLMTFAAPAVLVAVFLYRKKWGEALRLDRVPGWVNAMGGVLFILFSFQFAQLAYWLNRQIPLPDRIVEMERSVEALIRDLMQMETPGELMVMLLVVAAIPALGEEFVFRGFLQQKLQDRFRRPVSAIWITAIIFSIVHLQFQGFLPRVVLGAALGYLFFWTSNLWVPILAHFAFNGVQVLAQFYYGEQIAQMQTQSHSRPDWEWGALSLGLALAMGYFLHKINRTEQ